MHGSKDTISCIAREVEAEAVESRVAFCFALLGELPSNKL